MIRAAVDHYETALAEQAQPPATPQLPPQGAGGTRQLRLEEAVDLALEKNLDIQVERLNPQAVDLQIAGLRNTYKPVASSTIGQRDWSPLPRTSLVGGDRVSQNQTTYNAGLDQNVPWWGGNVALTFNNSVDESTANNVLFNPSYQSFFAASYTQPLLRGFRIDNTRQQLLVNVINQDVAEVNVRGVIVATVADVRNAYWDLVFSRSAVDVQLRSLQLAEKLVEDNKARVEVGTLAPIDVVQAEVQAANNRQTLALAEATAQTAQLALKRFLVSGTEDPLWLQEIVPVDLPSLAPPPADVAGAVRSALDKRTDLQNARKNIDSTDVSIRYFRNQALPAVDLLASYTAQGIGGTRNSVPGGYGDALSVLWGRDYPDWRVSATISYPIGGSQADAQYARARVQRQQAVTRLRALEVQVAAEVANAALTVQSNLKRVDAARAARELAQQQLEAEQSKFEVGMSTNFFVVQAQRDLANAENVELRAMADYRKSLVTFERAQEAPANGSSGGGSNTTGTGNTGTGGTGTNGTGTGGTGTGGPGGGQ